MENTFEKILKDGERKGYFRVLNDGAKIEYLPSGHKENLNDPEEKVGARKSKIVKKTFLRGGEVSERRRGWIPYWGFSSKNVRTSIKNDRPF